MKTVVLRLICDAGWTSVTGEFIGSAVLVDLQLDTGLVSPHFEHDPESLNARGPVQACGLLAEPAGADDGSWLILRPAWDFAGKATGFHIACQSLGAHRQELARWASWQERLSVIHLRFQDHVAKLQDRRAA